MTLYRIDNDTFTAAMEDTGEQIPLTQMLVNVGVLVPVVEWCLVHNQEPIAGRGFCVDYDLDEDGIEDCSVVRIGGTP